MKKLIAILGTIFFPITLLVIACVVLGLVFYQIYDSIYKLLQGEI